MGSKQDKGCDLASSFIDSVERLAEQASISTMSADQLLCQLVAAGVRDQKLKEKILEIGIFDLKLSRVKEVVRNYESVTLAMSKNKQQANSASAQDKCHRCGGKGHWKPNCPVRNVACTICNTKDNHNTKACWKAKHAGNPQKQDNSPESKKTEDEESVCADSAKVKKDKEKKAKKRRDKDKKKKEAQKQSQANQVEEESDCSDSSDACRVKIDCSVGLTDPETSFNKCYSDSHVQNMCQGLSEGKPLVRGKTPGKGKPLVKGKYPKSEIQGNISCISTRATI